MTHKYLIIARENGEHFSEVSPLLIHKSNNKVACEVKNIKNLRSGELFIETASKSQSELLLKCTNLNSYIKISNEKLNQCKGVIFYPDLDLLTEDEIQNELNNDKVVNVKIILIKKG